MLVSNKTIVTFAENHHSSSSYIMKIELKRHRSSIFAIILLVMAFVVCGCDKKKEEQTIKEPTTTSQVKEAPLVAVDDAEVAVQQPDDIPDETEEEEASPKKASLHPVYMGMWGNCGGTGFMFDMNGTKGSYIPYDMAEAKEYGARRQLELVSYDLSNGMCTINAFLKGKYIGQFQGIFEEEEVEFDENNSNTLQSYHGIFTSVNGAKLDFHFHCD